MPGDIAAKYSIDDSDVARALQATESRTDAHVNKMQTSFRKLSLAISAGTSALAVKSIEAYAERSEYAANQVERIKTAWADVQSNIGRDLLAGLDGVADLLKELDKRRGGIVNNVSTLVPVMTGELGLAMLDDTFVKAENWIANKLGYYKDLSPFEANAGTIGVLQKMGGIDANNRAVDESYKTREQQEREKRGTDFLKEQKLKANELVLAAAADDYSGYLSKIAAADRRYEESQRVIDKRSSGSNAIGSDAQRAALDLARETRDTEKRFAKKQYEDKVADAREKNQKAADDDERDHQNSLRAIDSEHDAAMAGYEIDVKRYAVQRLRENGRANDADVAEKLLASELKIMEIRNDPTLTDREKKYYISMAQENASAEIKAIKKRREENLHTVSMPIGTIGGAGGGLGAQIFGGSPSRGTIEEKQLTEAKKQTSLLQQIKDKSGAGAVFSR